MVNQGSTRFSENYVDFKDFLKIAKTVHVGFVTITRKILKYVQHNDNKLTFFFFFVPP